jgi:hypothetical protein
MVQTSFGFNGRFWPIRRPLFQLCHKLLDDELARWRDTGHGGRYEDAARLFAELIEAPTFAEFLTAPAYNRIVAKGHENGERRRHTSRN